MINRKLVLLFFLFILFSDLLFCQDTFQADSLSSKTAIIEDDPVVMMLDSLASLRIFEDTEFPNADQYQNWNTYNDNDIPVLPDSVYRERIAQMNDQSPIEFVFNSEVKKFIEVYAVKKRKLTARILGLSQIYFPLFEEKLDKYNMPLELKYLAVIESALNPTANSRAGAKGLWQFMYGTGKVYGLKVSSYVDDRYDPYKATIAACEHLRDLYDIYGSWSLALAAYNSGAGNVNKAIRRSGGMKNFWALHNYLPKETRSYVPAFIAATYVLTYASDHKIYPVDPGILFYEVDTVTVRNPLSFTQISEMLSIPREEIEFLNPSFKLDFIPATTENTYQLRLRKKDVGNFINNEKALYAFRPKNWTGKDSLMVFNYREADLYTVKSGETLAGIAKKFNMTVTEIKTLNGLKKNYVKTRQKLLVYTTPSKERQARAVNTPADPGGVSKTGDTLSPNQSKQSISQDDLSVSPQKITSQPSSVHVVKSGESLGSIAMRYHCSVNELVAWNNLRDSKILIGQKLKVTRPAAFSPTSSTSKPDALSRQISSGNGSTQAFFYYTIVSGDNLWDIADKFNVTVSQIKNLNDLKNSSRIRPGQKIKIPR